MATEKEPFLTRIRKEGARELFAEALRWIWHAIFSPWIAPLWLLAVAMVTASRVWVSQLDPLVIWVGVLLSFGAGLWLLNQFRLAIAPHNPREPLRTQPSAGQLAPHPRPPKPTPDMALGAAVRYLSDESSWGHGKDLSVIVGAIEAAIQRGALRTWGRQCVNLEIDKETHLPPEGCLALDFDPNEVGIDSHEWAYMRVWQPTVLTPAPSPQNPNMTLPKPGFTVQCYGYIRVNKEQLQKLYPSMFASA